MYSKTEKIRDRDGVREGIEESLEVVRECRMAVIEKRGYVW